MDTTKKIAALKRLIDQSSQIPVRDSSDPVFKTWKNTVERTLIRVFGEASPELAQFKQLRFFYQAIVMTLGDDYSHEHRQCFERDFKVLVSSINNYIEELEQDGEASQNDAAGSERRVRRVFISHASQDSGIVEELVELLEIIGLNHEHIFCTSFAGYGIDLGENFLDAIKDELINNDVLVLFVLTHHFYASPICLCEMGATWVLAREHIPVLVPPFEFSDVKGAIPLTQGFMLNDALRLNLFKDKVESALGLSSGLSQSAWERKRDRVLERINRKISAGERGV